MKINLQQFKHAEQCVAHVKHNNTKEQEQKIWGKWKWINYMISFEVATIHRYANASGTICVSSNDDDDDGDHTTYKLRMKL